MKKPDITARLLSDVSIDVYVDATATVDPRPDGLWLTRCTVDPDASLTLMIMDDDGESGQVIATTDTELLREADA